MRNKYFHFILLLLLSLGLDLGSKYWAKHTLAPIFPKTISVISGYFEFQYAENKGMAFSLFSGSPWLHWILLPIGVLCLGMVGYWLYQLPKTSKFTSAKLGMLAGGALGNIIDRFMHGGVTDFIVWQIPTSSHVYRWPTFNVADAFLVVGVVCLILNFPKDKDEPKTKSTRSS